MASTNKRSMDRETSPVSKRPRSWFSSDNDAVKKERFSPHDYERRDSQNNHRVDRIKYEYDPRDLPSSSAIPGPNYRSEFLVHDGPPSSVPPLSRHYDSRSLPPVAVSSYPPLPPRWPEAENDYRSLHISGIPSKIPEQVVRECLMDNYKRFGEMNVKITMSNDQRIAYLNFRYPQDAKEAILKGIKYLFDRDLKINPVYNKRRNTSPSRSIPSRPPPDPYYPHRHSPPPYDRRLPLLDVAYYGGRDDFGLGLPLLSSLLDVERKVEKFPYHLDHIDPEYDDKATRTLFVGNLDVNIADLDLRAIFGKFGYVEDVDIKRPLHNTGNAYAFVKFINLDCAHRAKVELSGKYIGRFQCKIGYGKVTPTTVVWVGGLGPWVNVETLEREFDRFGAIQHIEWPRNKNFAYVIYDSIDAAQAACQQMRGFPLGGPDRRLRLDFGQKDHISRSYALPDYIYPPPKDSVYGLPSDRPPTGPWRDIPRAAHDAPDWERDYRSLPSDPYRDIGRKHEDISTDRTGERRRELSPGYGKPQYHDSQRSPDRGRDYRVRSGISREKDMNLSERKEYIDLNPRDDYINNQCRTLTDLSKILPVAWNGALILKSSAFATSMFVVSGDVTLVDTLMRDPTSTECPVLKITQRLRLDQPKLDDVTRRIQATGSRGHCILLALPSSLPNYEESGMSIQQRPLKNLVTYLKQKEAAGAISLPPVPISGKKDIGVLHAFPPCDFGFNFLKKRASKLTSESLKEDHLVVVVIHGAS